MAEAALVLTPEHTGHVAVLRPSRIAQAELDTCSICLRVRHEDQWIEVETAIRALRSFEHPAPPRLLPALCDRCAALLALRRGRTTTAKAA
jgi:hypothetical protein